jgi:hypothetical protein
MVLHMSVRSRQQSSWTGRLTRVLELPSDNVTPLVQLEGKISVRLDPLGKVYTLARVDMQRSGTYKGT